MNSLIPFRKEYQHADVLFNYSCQEDLLLIIPVKQNST